VADAAKTYENDVARVCYHGLVRDLPAITYNL